MLFQGPRLRTSSAGRADGCHRAGLVKALGVANREIVNALVAVVGQARQIVAGALAGPDARLQRVQRKIGAQRLRDLPAHDPAGEHVDDKRRVDPAGEGPAVGDVSHPLLIRCGPDRQTGTGASHQRKPPPLPDRQEPGDLLLTHVVLHAGSGN